MALKNRRLSSSHSSFLLCIIHTHLHASPFSYLPLPIFLVLTTFLLFVIFFLLSFFFFFLPSISVMLFFFVFFIFLVCYSLSFSCSIVFHPFCLSFLLSLLSVSLPFSLVCLSLPPFLFKPFTQILPVFHLYALPSRLFPFFRFYRVLFSLKILNLPSYSTLLLFFPPLLRFPSLFSYGYLSLLPLCPVCHPPFLPFPFAIVPPSSHISFAEVGQQRERSKSSFRESFSMSGLPSKLTLLMGLHFVPGKWMALTPAAYSAGDVRPRKEREKSDACRCCCIF